MPAKVLGDILEEVRKIPAKKSDDTGDHESFDGCCYPDCLFSSLPSGGPNLDTCQGDCNKMKRFHHTCNIAWFESQGRTNEELRKLCIDCVMSNNV